MTGVTRRDGARAVGIAPAFASEHCEAVRPSGNKYSLMPTSPLGECRHAFLAMRVALLVP